MSDEIKKYERESEISSELRTDDNNNLKSQFKLNKNYNETNLTTQPYSAEITQENKNKKQSDKNKNSHQKKESKSPTHNRYNSYNQNTLNTTREDLLRLSKYSSKFAKTSYSNSRIRKVKSKKNDFHKTITDAAIRSCHILDKVVDNPRYLGFSEFQSKNTFLNSSYCWSFTKNDRFKTLNSSKVNDHMYTLPSLMMKRTTTLGLGLRKDLRPVPGQGSQEPGAYTLKSVFDSNQYHKKGATVTGRYKLPNDDSVNKPAPNNYNVVKDLQKSYGKIDISLKSRQGFFYDDDLKKKKFTVSMQKYWPKMSFVQKERFKFISFGIGQRKPLYIDTKTPGPGSYNIPGFCDRGLKGKLVIN
jgi:hypothetical protein